MSPSPAAGGTATDLDEALFLLEDVIAGDTLYATPAFAHTDADSVRSALRAATRYTTAVLMPTNAPGDRHGAQLVDGRVRTAPGFGAAYRQYCEDGWPGFDLPLEHGGQALPLCAQVALAEQVNRANVAFGMLPIMLRAGAWLLLEHADAPLVARVVPALVRGEWGATICISEPQAGSDVGRIATRAVPCDAVTHAISGTKAWISYGDHDLTTQAVHFVLARTPDAPPGTRGLSLFLVPRLRFDDGARNGWSVLRLEDKLGLHASPTCVLQFEGALGYRIGPPHEGLRCLFTMVNLMRLEVAIQGVAVAGIAAAKAAQYASQRLQGGAPDAPPVPIATHRDVQRLLVGMQARLRPLRGLVFEAAYQLDRARAAHDTETRNEARAWAEWWLPICKTSAAESGFDIASDAVQVAGGFGYTRDGGLEQHLRDARVMAVYEGTSGIQALDLVLRKVRRDRGARALAICARLGQDLQARSEDAATASLRAGARAALDTLVDATHALVAATDADAETAALDYLKLACLAGCGWMWVRMLAATAGAGAEADFRHRCARFFAARELPLAQVYRARIAAGSAALDA